MLFNCGVGEDSWESHWMQRNPPVHPKGNPSWIFIGRTDSEAETPIFRPPDVKNWLIGKDPDAGKDWRREEKGMTEDEMAEWYHWLNGHEFESTPGIGDGQGGLAWCSPWGRKELDTNEWLNWTELREYPPSGNQDPKSVLLSHLIFTYLEDYCLHFARKNIEVPGGYIRNQLCTAQERPLTQVCPFAKV